MEVHTYIAEFEEYLDNQIIDAVSNNVLLPQSMAFNSLVFALNSVDWTIMWETNKKGEIPLYEWENVHSQEYQRYDKF